MGTALGEATTGPEEGELQMRTVMRADVHADSHVELGVRKVEEIRGPRRTPALESERELTDPNSPVVLIVDDDSAARLALCALLWSEGYHIAFATSADDARERLPEIQPDVILCDLIMQGTNGDQFCSWLKSHGTWRYVPVIAVTSVNNTIATAAMLEAGADDVIVKPVKARDLQARVGAALRTRDRYLDLARGAVRAVVA